MLNCVTHYIDHDPQPEAVGAIRITATILGESDDPLTYSTKSLVKEFIDDDQDECKIKQDLIKKNLLDAGINEDDTLKALIHLVDLVAQVTCHASEYSPGCALYVWLDFRPHDDFDDAEIDEAVQLSFDETNNIRFRPASKQVVKSLARKIYNKKIQKKNKKTKNYKDISLEECTICLKKLSDGGRVVTLPCGHDFDDECIVKWFETSHVCPLCRFELPCDDQ